MELVGRTRRASHTMPCCMCSEQSNEVNETIKSWLQLKLGDTPLHITEYESGWSRQWDGEELVYFCPNCRAKGKGVGSKPIN